MSKTVFDEYQPRLPKGVTDSKSSMTSKASSILSGCRICLSSLLDPASLTCGHKFCEDCLQKYWHVKEKPDIIVCPLCRASAVGINFTEHDDNDKPSREDFRKTFTIMDKIRNSKSVINESMSLYLKISILIAIICFLFKYLNMRVIDLWTLFDLKSSHET